jgi:hypothetical protein
MANTDQIGNPTFLDHAARLAAGQTCLDAALQVYLPHGFSVTCCCDPDHIGVGRTHGKHCTSPGKSPMHAWKSFQGRLPLADEVRRRWQGYPIGNIGTILGQVSGLVRIDVDGPPGETTLQTWSRGDLPPTWEFRSSPSGRGLLYRWPQGQPCHTVKASADGQHNELRLMGDGAQTVLPPSRHSSGSLYTWVPGHGPADLPLALAPTWLVTRMQVTPTVPRPAVPPTAAPDLSYAQELLRFIPNTGSYDDWIRIGMALHHTGADWGLPLWDGWSQQCLAKYHVEDQARHWESFSQTGPQGKDPVTFGSLVHLAWQGGYRPQLDARPVYQRGRVYPSIFAGPMVQETPPWLQ